MAQFCINAGNGVGSSPNLQPQNATNGTNGYYSSRLSNPSGKWTIPLQNTDVIDEIIVSYWASQATSVQLKIDGIVAGTLNFAHNWSYETANDPVSLTVSLQITIQPGTHNLEFCPLDDGPTIVLDKTCFEYTVPLVGNDEQVGLYQKAGCPAHFEGSFVLYRVPENTYSATTKAAANQLALDDVAANGQNYANANGVCNRVEWGNLELSQAFTPTCPGHFAPAAQVVYTVLADKYFASSQALSNQLALDDIAASGQNYANSNGVCERVEWGNQRRSASVLKAIHHPAQDLGKHSH